MKEMQRQNYGPGVCVPLGKEEPCPSSSYAVLFQHGQGSVDVSLINSLKLTFDVDGEFLLLMTPIL